MNESTLDAIRDIIQEDVNKRGLATVAEANLITAWPGDFRAACQSIAAHPQAVVGVVTGFFIPHATPPCGETDGPLGALFLARALTPLGIRVVLATDPFCVPALEAGLQACGLASEVPVLWLARQDDPDLSHYAEGVDAGGKPMTHWLALERVGPSHTPESLRAQSGATPDDLQRFLREVTPDQYDRCYSMRGRDLTAFMRPGHLVFEQVRDCDRNITTIGIGDGGNEIGMGKVSWEVIRRNIPNGGLVACRVPADHLIVCGVSNWGAYGLAAGVRLLRGQPLGPDLADVERERELLQLMVERGPLVDGVTGQQTATVDGLSFERYVEPLQRIAQLR